MSQWRTWNLAKDLGMKMKQEIKVFNCERCKNKFSGIWSLKKHLRKVHGIWDSALERNSVNTFVFVKINKWSGNYDFLPPLFSKSVLSLRAWSPVNDLHPLERYIALTLPTKICSTGVDCGMTRVTLLYLYDLEGWASPEIPFYEKPLVSGELFVFMK